MVIFKFLHRGINCLFLKSDDFEEIYKQIKNHSNKKYFFHFKCDVYIKNYLLVDFAFWLYFLMYCTNALLKHLWQPT